MVAGGRTFARSSLDLVPFAELTWRAEAPRTGELLVVELAEELRGLVGADPSSRAVD